MKSILAGIFVLVTISMTARSQVKVGFEVSFTEPQAHYAEVEMNISGLTKEYIDVKMPVWTPGSYLIREFSKNVEGFTATANGKKLKTEKIKKNAWRIHSAKSSQVKISYRVYAYEISVRTSFIDASHAFLSSADLFMYPDGFLKAPSTVKVKPFGNWEKISTGLEPLAGQPYTYTAPNFDILYDSPFEVGNQDVFEFNASGVQHQVAMYGGGNYDKEKLKVDMAKLVEQGTAIYGENPNKHYTFIVHNYMVGTGGLEHLNSTVLSTARKSWDTPEGYKGFLSLVAHEYYHLWNVKRLRPVALGPFDYDNENYTTNLWIAEGFTSYYENKLMQRAGFSTTAETAQALASAIAGVVNAPGSKVQSVAEASFDAWIKYYRPNENSNNATVSYYNKGKVIGMFMDLEIANATNGTNSLDDVMKAMYTEYYKKLGRGYTDAEFKTMVEKISGISFTKFWKDYVNGTTALDYQKYFGYIGVKITDDNAGLSIPYLGVTTDANAPQVVVTKVARGSSAWDSGINVNDVLLSIDGAPAVKSSLEKMPEIAGKKVGDSIAVTLGRDGNVRELSVVLKANTNVRLLTEVDESASAKQLKVREGWIK